MSPLLERWRSKTPPGDAVPIPMSPAGRPCCDEVHLIRPGNSRTGFALLITPGLHTATRREASPSAARARRRGLDCPVGEDDPFRSADQAGYVELRARLPDADPHIARGGDPHPLGIRPGEEVPRPQTERAAARRQPPVGAVV